MPGKKRADAEEATGDPWEPLHLHDPSGRAVQPVLVFLNDLQAAGRSAATQRSYGLDLLRWFRFCWAVGIPWEQATRAEGRDFSRWLQLAIKPRRLAASAGSGRGRGSLPGTPNQVTGKPSPGVQYAAVTAAHCETVLRHFYDFHLEAGTGPMVNPFPLARDRRDRGANAHRSPMERARNRRSGLFRPTLPQRIPRSIPDEKFGELFAALASHRDRALVAFWISTGARASELLGARQGTPTPASS